MVLMHVGCGGDIKFIEIGPKKGYWCTLCNKKVPGSQTDHRKSD
jgi:hypothetical protein